MKILVVNAGSSSLKYQLFDMDDNRVIAKGNCEKIGIGGLITHKRPGKEDYKAEVELKDHDDAIALVLKLLTDAELGVIASIDEIDAIGHRVAHGGKLKESPSKAGMETVTRLLHAVRFRVGRRLTRTHPPCRDLRRDIKKNCPVRLKPACSK